MDAVIHIQMNAVSALLCILLYYQQKKHNAFNFLGTTAFNSILWTTVTLMIVDAASWLMLGGAVPQVYWLLMLLQSIYYFLQALLPLLFMEYGLQGSGQKDRLILRLIRHAPVLFTLGVLILNFNHHFAFDIRDNLVVRESGFLYAILAPMLYISFSLLCSAVFFIRSSPERKKVSLHMFICVLISFIGALLSALIPGVSPWHIFVFALLYLYMQLHGAQERNLDFLAYTDSLTGLKNFAAYSHLKQMVDQKLSADPDFRFAVAIMDINDLKKVNDVYGHAAGNELIRRSGQLICDTFRHSPVCRIGGDEFVAILENSDYENRRELQSQFNVTSAQTIFSFNDQQLPVSVALGISSYQPELHRCFDDVVREADKAMYEHKALCKKV